MNHLRNTWVDHCLNPYFLGYLFLLIEQYIGKTVKMRSVLILIFLDIFFYTVLYAGHWNLGWHVLILIFLDIFFYDIPMDRYLVDGSSLNPYFLGYLFLLHDQKNKETFGKIGLNPYFLGYLFLLCEMHKARALANVCLNPYFLGYLFLQLLIKLLSYQDKKLS